MRTDPPSNTPRPTLEVTPVLFQPTGVPPTLLVLPVPNRTALTLSANLHTPEAFPSHLPEVKTYLRAMIASYPPLTPTPLPLDLTHYLHTNSYILAFSNTTAVAFLLFNDQPHDTPTDDLRTCQLHYILVHPQWRRRATAFYLLAELVAYGVRRGMDRLTAMVPGLPSLLRFIGACGFVPETAFDTSSVGPRDRTVWVRTIRAEG